ncbi:hypothetical protein EI546_06630 [Aequorivita sp. H23M31]|uniref:Uncharacterized protein n=1 Tax=Aequorivita ciconiae TaxID=2494375 RepID=A0A410G2G9_9FLAO|nr:hypothetical protein [Aequorivita sp. H23M31]QAA81425.1 hypothetical protein EI546_06630 [Aequorivita sp. H23M31]
MVNGNIYSVDYDKFREQLLPLVLRKPKLLSFLRALISPFVSIHGSFFNFKTEAIYKTEHNASITLLQKVLNDHFDNVERRIFINNASITATQHYYDKDQGEPLYFYDKDKGDPQWFFDMGTFNVYGSDFTVFLPIGMRPLYEGDEERLLTRIKAYLDYYKMFGTKYTIIWLS